MNTPDNPGISSADDANAPIGLVGDSPEETATNRVSGNKGKTPKPSFSQYGHWVWMNRALTDAGFRYYSAVRSYIFDADEEFEVDLTDEVIAELLSKNPKSIARARRDCYKAGVIEELATWKESVRVEGKAKPEVRTFRRLIVHHEVPEGYDGPVNAYAEKRAVERRRTQEQKDARAEREQARQAARQAREQCDRTDLSSHTAQGVSSDSSEAPAQCDRTDLSSVGTNLSSTGTNLSASTGDAQEKQVPHLPSHLPSHQPTQSAADAAGLDGSNESQNEDGDARPGPSSAALPDTPGVRYLQSFQFRNQRFSARAVRDLYEHVDALLASGWTEQQVTDAITDTTGVGVVQRPIGFVRQKLDTLAPKASGTGTDVQAQIDALVQRGNSGAQQAAGLLGEFWDPEQYRTNEGAQDWIMVARPRLARDYIEARREQLADTLARAAA